MKTILDKSSKVSVYILPETTSVALGQSSIVVGDPVEYIIWDMNVNNAEVIADTNPPNDWESRKYVYTAITSTWTLNPDWDTWDDVQDENLQYALDSKVNLTEYTDNDVLTKIIRVDGAGSGLDADLLDGYQASDFLQASIYTAYDVLNKVISVDGAGSGLDADALDGQHGSYYLNPANLSTIIPVDKLGGTYAIDVNGNATTASSLETPREISLTGDVTGLLSFDGSTDVDVVTVLEQFNTNVNANYNRIVNLDDPINFNDATNKQYVDSLVNNVIQLLDRGRAYYVDVNGTDEPECGGTPANPFKTIRYACERIAADQAEAGTEFRSAIHITVGTYPEQLPIVVPPFTSIVGDTQRATLIVPASGYSEGYEVESFTADEGQTELYTDTVFDDIKVYVNSVLLTEDTDYEVRRKKIVFASPLSEGDSIILNNYVLNKHNTMFKMSNGTLAIKFLVAGLMGWSNEEEVELATDGTVSLEDHGYTNGDYLRFISAEGDNESLTNKHVYVINATANTDAFQLSYEIEGDPILFDDNTSAVLEDSDITTAKPRGVVFALNPDSPIVTTSPYILECAHISTYISGGGRAIGAYIDGNAITSFGATQTEGTKSMLFHAFTNIIDDGVAFWCDNGGVCELVSCFTYYCKAGYASTRGGYIRSLNGSNSWGIRALYSKGYLLDENPITSTIYGEQFYYTFLEATANTSAELETGDFIFSDTENNAVGTLIANQPIEKKIIYQPVYGQFTYEYEEGSPFSIYANSDVTVSNTDIEINPGAEPKYVGSIVAEATSSKTPVSYQQGKSISIYNLQKYNEQTDEFEPFADILKEGASITMNDVVGRDEANNIVYEENSYVIQTIKEAGTGIVEEYDEASNTTIEIDSTVYVLGLVQDKAFETLPGWTATMRYKFSQVRCSGHDLLDIGTGNWDTTNLYDPELPSRSANNELEVAEFAPGRVFYVTTDQDGNFKIGNYFEVNQGTGQIYLDASVFELASVESFNVGILTVGGTNPISGVSTDVNLVENSNVLIPTQRAIKTYVDTEIQAVDDRNLDYEESNLYPINIAHNANTATALETPRYFNLTNDASGQVLFDGTSNADIEVTANYGPNLLVGRDISEEYYRDNGILVNWKNTKLTSVIEYIGDGTQSVVAVLSSTSQFSPVVGDVLEIAGSEGTEEEKFNGRWNVIDVDTNGANTEVTFVLDETLSANTYSSNVGDVYIAHTGYFGINSDTNRFDFIPNATKNVVWDPSLSAEITDYVGEVGTIHSSVVGESVQANTIIASEWLNTGALTATSGVINSDLLVIGDLIVEGDTVSMAITQMAVEDPRIAIGIGVYANGELAEMTDVGRRGIEFWYNAGGSPSGNLVVGFFGYQPDEDIFKFISAQAGNTGNEVKGTLDAYIEYEDVLNTPNTWVTFSDGINSATPDGIYDTFTFVAGDGLTVAVSGVNDTATYDHYQPSTTDLTEWHRTYVTGLTYDDYGHITGYTTNAEHVLDTTYVLNVLDPIGANNNVRIELAGTDGNTSSSDIVTIEGDDNIVITKNGETVVITAPDVDTTVFNDTTTDTTQYLLSARQTSGALTDAYVANTNLYFNPNTGTLTAQNFDSLSDVTLKENVKELSNTIEILDQLVPVEFTWKNNGEKAFGMIAQEVEKVLPEIVNENESGTKSVAYTQLIPFLVETVKKQQKEIDELKALIKNNV